MSDELEEGDYEMVRVGTHLITVSNKDGEPNINIRDHADIVVDGEHKADPTVNVVANEWPTTFQRRSEGWVWERYYGDE